MENLINIASQIIVIGDKEKFLCCLITLKSEMIEGQPSNRLSLPVIEFLKTLNINKTNVADVIDEPKLIT